MFFIGQTLIITFVEYLELLISDKNCTEYGIQQKINNKLE